MTQSDSIKELATALSLAQGELKAVPFDKKNDFLKNDYATLGSVIESSRAILAKNGLAVSQLTVTELDRIGVTTILMHKSGEWISGTATLATGEERGKSSAQVAGSVITYLRRYSLASILGMYADEDTDGNHQQPAAKPAQKPAEPAPNGHKPEPEPVAADADKPVCPIYTSPKATIHKHQYPSLWVKAIMAVPEYAADQPHIDNILQNMALPQATDAADVVAKLNAHMAAKANGG